MRAVIMAGGEGKRLRPFTHSIPKPLLPIGRKPVAQIIVERLRKAGFEEIIMSLGYGADLIRAFFQDGSQFGAKITYYQEPSKMGTAGCLAHIKGLDGGPFLVTNGDILTDLDYVTFLQAHNNGGAAMTVAVRRDEIAIPYGVLKLNGGDVCEVEEKPVLNYCFNAGIYALSPESVSFVPPGEPSDMTDLITKLLAAKKRVASYALDGLWFDLARVDDFEKALAELERTNPDLL